MAYTVAALVWKTTYRVVWDPAGNPLLQGWAIVDNPTDEDWSGVELTLVSGTPSSSVRTLGRPLSAYRPVESAPAGVSPIPQSVLLAAIDVDFFVAQGYLDASAQTALRRLVELRERKERQTDRLSLLESEKEAINDEQKRIRDNIEAFAKKSSDANPLISRYLAKADQQETRLEQIAAETRASEAEKLQVTQTCLKACKDLPLKRTLIADPTVW